MKKLICLLTLCAGLALAQSADLTLCQMDGKRASDACLTIPGPVVDSIVAWMATQTVTVDGVPTPKYSSVLALIDANTKAGLIAAILDQFPTAEITAAKDAAETKRKALDRAKEDAMKPKKKEQ